MPHALISPGMRPPKSGARLEEPVSTAASSQAALRMMAVTDTQLYTWCQVGS